MAAYLIGTITVRDPDAWQAYVARVGATFGPFKGRVTFRGEKAIALSGAAHGQRVVVVEFPDLDSLRRWHESPQYQELIALRNQGAEVVLTAYTD
jgi:uncharacterized protein (DUF1330 family)